MKIQKTPLFFPTQKHVVASPPPSEIVPVHTVAPSTVVTNEITLLLRCKIATDLPLLAASSSPATATSAYRDLSTGCLPTQIAGVPEKSQIVMSFVPSQPSPPLTGTATSRSTSEERTRRQHRRCIPAFSPSPSPNFARPNRHGLRLSCRVAPSPTRLSLQ